MTKLSERDQTREAVQGLPQTHPDLPELPHDVEVPDDVSGITHPATARVDRPATGVRWMRWLVAAVLLAAGAVVAALVMRSDTSDTVVDDGYAVAEANRMNTLQDLSAIPAPDGYTTAEANRANTLQDLAAIPAPDGYTTAEINRMNTMRYRAIGLATAGHTTAEINRMNTLRDLAIDRALDGYTTAEVNRMDVLRDLSG